MPNVTRVAPKIEPRRVKKRSRLVMAEAEQRDVVAIRLGHRPLDLRAVRLELGQRRVKRSAPLACALLAGSLVTPTEIASP
jgi:hypothetical protein